MFEFMLLCFLGFVGWDMRLCRKQDEKAFLNVFQERKQTVFSFFMFVVFFSMYEWNGRHGLSVFLFLSIFPLYFYKRYLFNQSCLSTDTFDAATKGMQVVLYWFFGVIMFHLLEMCGENIFGPVFEELEVMVLAALFSSALLIFLIARNASVFKQATFWENVGFKKNGGAWVRGWLIPVGCGCVMAYFSATVITERLIQPDTPLNEVLYQSTSPWAIALFIFLALAVAPLVEEITFRGFFFNVLKKTCGQRAAFYVISFTFGMLHMAQYWGDWMAITVILIMGFVLTSMRVLSGTTAASVWTHYVYNIGVVVFAAMMEMGKG